MSQRDLGQQDANRHAVNRNDVSRHDSERQQQLQAMAERAERELAPAGDPQVDAYRLVLRALQQPLPDALPAGFAQQVARRLQAHEASSRLERWLTHLLLLIMVVAMAWFAVPPLVATMAQTLRLANSEALPWSSVCIASAGIGMAWMLDRYWSSASHRR
jgi:hypothetical protein